MLPIEINRNSVIDLEGIKLDYSLMKMIPKEIMVKHNVIPLYIKDNSLYIAVSDIEDDQFLKDISFITKKNLIIYISRKNQILKALNNMEKIQDTDLILEQLKLQYEKLTEEDSILSSAAGTLDSSPAVKLANTIIEQGINYKASDIHIEPMKDNVRVRYRIDGYLIHQYDIHEKFYPTLCSRIKLQANMDISEKRLPQDGKIVFNCDMGNVDLRVSTMPVLYGEKIVIRILYKNSNLLNLKTLGFVSEDETLIEKFLQSPHGIILVTGPTGSGKTTTLYSMVNLINQSFNNVVTIEDPIEIAINGINQVNVNYKIGLSFANGLRNILRQDPDIVMLGEIRDEETAEIAVRAAITGHLVIATLHTNDAASCISRLIDMKAPKYLVADSLIACIAQRLVRRICSFCKVSYMPSKEERSELMLSENQLLYKGTGCMFCNNTGYKGRVITYEIMKSDSKLRTFIGSSRTMDEIRELNRVSGMKPLKENCRELVKTGITTYMEYVKICRDNF